MHVRRFRPPAPRYGAVEFVFVKTLVTSTWAAGKQLDADRA
jgi:hypothetical protein